jgi:hypothetical protein
VGSGALGECVSGAWAAARERDGSTIGRERGGAGESAVREVGFGGGVRFGDAPARSAVRGPDCGGGTVRQPCACFHGERHLAWSLSYLVGSFQF